MGRADDRRRDQAGTARRPAERQNALLAVASPAVGGPFENMRSHMRAPLRRNHALLTSNTS